MTMTFDTKICVVLADDLAVWQRLNVTAFLVSGIAATVPEVTGAPYEDASGNQYLPMFQQPVMVHEASAERLRTVVERACTREITFAIFTRALFGTGNESDNRAAVRAVAAPDLEVVGIAFRAERKLCDKVLKGVPLHR